MAVLDLEQRLGLHYTVDTLRYLTAHSPETEFVWLMGADNLAGFHRWRSWRSIAQALPIAVIDRAPYALRALSGKFARRFAHARVPASAAGLLGAMAAPAWVYLAVPRHPLSATVLRKTLGKKAFLRHTARKPH
jgi:nicotinate-nucleotide adenylyltransferase